MHRSAAALLRRAAWTGSVSMRICLVGAISHSSTGGQHDFSSESQTRADPHEVQVEDGYAAEAERVLSTMPAT
jgi:hypothetical protein